MAFSRRPTRFKRQAFMPTKTIRQEQLELLRAAATRVIVNEQNPNDEESSISVLILVVTSVGSGGPAKVKEAAGIESGVQLLAEASIIKKESEENKF
ncbi:hypothetical protein SESBI_50140 [Sesbania bispinosa]|nr:hypothetical protein SESBI_50140 [Sesbania bispinosa]